MNPRHKTLFLIVAACIIFLMVSACAGLSVEERFNLASECQVTADQNCEELWADWNHAVEVQDRRDAAKEPPCSQGYVLYCDRWCSQTQRSIRGIPRGVCVKSSSIAWD